MYLLLEWARAGFEGQGDTKKSEEVASIAAQLRSRGQVEKAEKLEAQHGAEDPGECPAMFAHVYQWWQEISHQRPVGLGLGPVPLSELDSYLRMTGRELVMPSFEVPLFIQIDAAFRVVNRKKEPTSSPEQPKGK